MVPLGLCSPLTQRNIGGGMNSLTEIMEQNIKEKEKLLCFYISEIVEAAQLVYDIRVYYGPALPFDLLRRVNEFLSRHSHH